MILNLFLKLFCIFCFFLLDVFVFLYVFVVVKLLIEFFFFIEYGGFFVE